MIVLSAATVRAASGVGVGVLPAEQALNNKLARISVINNLWFMIFQPPKIFLSQSYGFPGKLPLPSGEFSTVHSDSMFKRIGL
jgi:hypothetical protein